MYKNQRRRAKRNVAATTAAKEPDVLVVSEETGGLQQEDLHSNSPRKSQSKERDNLNGSAKKKRGTTSATNFDNVNDDSDRPQKEKGKSLAGKKSSETANSKSAGKVVKQTQKFIIDTFSSEDEALQRQARKSSEKRLSSDKANSKTVAASSGHPCGQVEADKGKLPTKKKSIENTNSKQFKKKSPAVKSGCIDESSSEDEAPQKEKQKSPPKRKSAENGKSVNLNKAAPSAKKVVVDESSSDDDLLRKEKQKSLHGKKSTENGNSKNLKKPNLEAKRVFDESSSEDEISLTGKGKSLVNKKANPKSSIKVVPPAEKITIDSSSSEVETPPKEKEKPEETNKSKGSKTVPSPSKTVTVDYSSTDDDIPKIGKRKSLQTNKPTENKNGKSPKKMVTSTQKSKSDDSSTDMDAPPRAQKRSGGAANGIGPPAKRTPVSSQRRYADFPASQAVSSIFSPSSSPEKRSRIPAASQKKKSFLTNRNVGQARMGNPFFDQLSELGFTFGEGNEPNCLDRDQASFVRSLDSALRNNKKYPQNVDDFVRHFEAFMTDSMENLGRVLEYTQSSDDFARKSVQECLVRLLLNVDCIQPKLWGMLLAKISELVIDEEEEQANFEMVHRIMRQMRCLDRVIEGDVNICDQLFVISELATKEDTKREIILLLPDVISEEDHEKAARTISDALTSNHALIPAYLDTLSSLVLSEDRQKDVVDRVIDILSRADTKYFQVIIKFLLMTAKNLEPVVRGIRKHLDLDPAAYGNDGNEGIMLTNTLKDVDDKKALVVTWMDLVHESVPQQWLAVDFVALLVNYGKVKVPVMAAFKKLAAQGAEGEKDVEKVYPSIKSILEQDYLDTMRQILNSLFKSRVTLESRHAAFWYRLLLNRIKTWHVSQKILDDVMSHIGHSSGNPAEVSLALNCLIDAANENRDSVARHSQRLLSLLHDLESWPLAQVRQVMNLLLSLVYHKEGAAGMQDVMTITIRKHLNHPSFV